MTRSMTRPTPRRDPTATEAVLWLAGFATPGDSPAWRRFRATLFDAAWLACLAAVLARYL